MQTLERQLKELIVRELHLDDVTPDSIDSETPLFGEGLGLDSVDALELAMAIQNAFGVEINPDDAEQRSVMTSVRRLAAYIEELRSGAPTTGD